MAVVADRIRAHLECRSWQRFHCALIVTLSAASAFLVSHILMPLHVWRMSWRYGLAAQRRESSHWTADQFKRTILPALIVVASAAVAGYAFNRIAPEAVTVGGVWHHLAAKYGW